MLDPVADCNDPNVTDVCECDTPKYSLLRWDENLITEFGLLCGPKLNFALPDLFFNIGVTTACLLGVLMNSFQVRFLISLTLFNMFLAKMGMAWATKYCRFCTFCPA